MTRDALSRLAGEHRRLDELFGRFLSAAHAGAPAEARAAIQAFDESLRAHTAAEESLFPPRARKLLPVAGETDSERTFRELALEHVQLRELSAIILRGLSSGDDLLPARSLAPALARRWDAHTAREEAEWGGRPGGAAPDEMP